MVASTLLKVVLSEPQSFWTPDLLSITFAYLASAIVERLLAACCKM